MKFNKTHIPLLKWIHLCIFNLAKVIKARTQRDPWYRDIWGRIGPVYVLNDSLYVSGALLSQGPYGVWYMTKTLAILYNACRITMRVLQGVRTMFYDFIGQNPDSKVPGDNMGPTWVLSAPDGPHVGSMNLAIKTVKPI